MPSAIVMIFRDVGVVREVLDGCRRPARAAVTSSKTGPSGEAEGGQQERRGGDGAGLWAVPVMNRRRVTVSPSKAPGMFRSAVYLLLILWRSGHLGEDLTRVVGILSARQHVRALRYAPDPETWRAAATSASAAPSAPSCWTRNACSRAGSGPQPIATTPACQAAAGAPRRRGLGSCAERDHVREAADGVQVAELGQPRQAQRVEPVARQQREVAVGVARMRPAPVCSR